MTLNEFQALATRTMNKSLTPTEWEMHALHGMVSEIGEVHSIYQKAYQGHAADEAHIASELGDLLWFIAEWCTARNIDLDDIAKHNIDKLKARYPEGFSSEKSLHRAEGDI